MLTTQPANQNSKQIHVTGAKRGKTRAAKTRLVLVWIPIGWESGASFVNRSQSVMQNQSKREITFDTQLKIALTPFRICIYSRTPPYDHLVIKTTILCPERIESPVISLVYNLVNQTTPLFRPHFHGPKVVE